VDMATEVAGGGAEAVAAEMAREMVVEMVVEMEVEMEVVAAEADKDSPAFWKRRYCRI